MDDPFKNYFVYADSIEQNGYSYSFPTTTDSAAYGAGGQLTSCFYGNSAPQSFPISDNQACSFVNDHSANQTANYYGNQEAVPCQNNMLNYNAGNQDRGRPVESHALSQWENRTTSLDLMKPSENAKDVHLSSSGSKAIKKKKAPRKKDVNKPQKPVSAYAHFFREKQTEIKTKNPDASFGEVSKIVAAEWESLPNQMKVIYKKKADQEKQEYLRAVATLKANVVAGNFADSAPSSEAPLVEEVTISHTGNNMVQQVHSIIPPQQAGCTSASNDCWSSEFGPNLVWSSLSDQTGNNSSIASQGNQAQDGRCIRLGCSNTGSCNPGWDNEYCSNDCAVTHCKDVFDSWLEARQSSVTNH